MPNSILNDQIKRKNQLKNKKPWVNWINQLNSWFKLWDWNNTIKNKFNVKNEIARKKKAFIKKKSNEKKKEKKKAL
jgi:hypothetical protein